jgi:mannose-6-phosphate isomerase-like protein (cupin superfamily)
MPGYTKINLIDDVEDMALKYGQEGMQSRFARRALALEKHGLSHFRLEPSFRMPFGHRHAEQEEVYLVLSGSARMRLGDDIVDLRAMDAVRVPPETWRGIEAGPDGAELLVTGAPSAEQDTEMDREWWT